MSVRRWMGGLAATVIVVGIVVAAASPASAVANGIAAVPGQDPFAVQLTMTHIPRPDGTFYNSACSAALVSPTWIITRPATGSIVTLAGWGATSDVNPTPSTTLNLGQMKISKVQTSYIYVVGYAPARNTSACLYDSGAPYFTSATGTRPQLVSVESNGPNCPHTSAETTARTDNISAWITSIATG